MSQYGTTAIARLPHGLPTPTAINSHIKRDYSILPNDEWVGAWLGRNRKEGNERKTWHDLTTQRDFAHPSEPDRPENSQQLEMTQLFASLNPEIVWPQDDA